MLSVVLPVKNGGPLNMARQPRSPHARGRLSLPGGGGRRRTRQVVITGAGNKGGGEAAGDLGGEAEGDAATLARARASLEAALADSLAGDEEEVLSEEGLAVLVWEGAMLPGFREVLAIKEPRLQRMFNQLLARGEATGASLRYVHFSASSAIAARAGQLALEALYPYDRPRTPRPPSALMPRDNPRREAVGTMMEVCLAEREPDGRLMLVVRALGAVRLVRLTQSTPFLRAVVEWRPDEEETEAAGGAAPAVVAGELWAVRYEVPLGEAELEGCHPLAKHLVEVARRFHELGPPGSEGLAAEAVAAEAADAAHWAATPGQRSLAAGAGPGTDAAAETLSAPVWDALRRIEELQEAIRARASTSHSPSMARAMRPIVTPVMATALAPLLEEDEPAWRPLRRARWLSFALAAALPEVARGPGRQALLEAPSVAARLALCMQVLSLRQQQLGAFLTLLEAEGAGSSVPEGENEEKVKAEEQGRQGPTLAEAARLERLMGGGGEAARLDATNDAQRAADIEAKRARKRWLQRRLIQEAAECMIDHGGDLSACEEEWRAVRELSEEPTIEEEEEGGR
mmetsp:Transcript_19372/g.49759  ORF Transcript_19372/g.49759 Transcript_19372/m.49759 type:complete len:573 (-) Transcript_19372:149-1867(-)